ncbi:MULTISPECIES: conjugal transfer protein TraE [Erwiniaceae]|uniref:conjugal transfer protein TraE n=1 Tax=Erwiniaceae TaxID=1903409 RepID=UPI0024B7555B|nr:conjugal transfer protein TraE [Pantoea ananatis]MDJ0034099.1 conjugal transfer protein TraE [Pantoea ananatis]
MKRMNLTEILSRVTLEQTDEQRQLLEQFAEGKKTVSPPVTIRFRPASREFVNQVSHKLGISVSELVNVIVEGVMTETTTPRKASVNRVYERFWHLMDRHGLDVAQVATLLSELNIGMSVLENRERTLDHLTLPVLEQLASWFGVQSGWLAGEDTPPVQTIELRDFWQAAECLLPHKDTVIKSLRFYRRQHDAGEPALNFSHKMVITATRNKYINGVSFESNYLTGVVPLRVTPESETNAFLSFCELLRLKGRVAQISFRKVPGRLFDSLRDGSELPFSVSSVTDESIMGKLRPGQNFMWNEEELIPFINPAFHITPEWEDYLKEVMSFG